MSANENRIEVFHRILSVADRILLASSQHTDLNYVDHSANSPFSRSAIPLDLALPTDTVSVFHNEGIAIGTANKLSEIYSSFCNRLSERLESNYQKTWSNLTRIGAPGSSISLDELQCQLRSTYSNIYSRRIDSWIDNIRNRIREGLVKSTLAENSMSSGAAERTKGQQPPFNHSYLPALEAFFSEEQFPSRGDKIFLAKKSGMSYRQIHVWFQNRRCRTKKQATTGNYSKEENSNFFCPSDETDVDDDTASEDRFISRSSSMTLVNDEDVFKSVAPAYAFPTKYPPDLDAKLDPFPCRSGDFSSFSSSRLEWRPAPPLVHQEVDIAVLIGAFETLTIEESPNLRCQSTSIFDRNVRSSTITARKCTGCDVMAPYTTRPSRAPLDSLIRNMSPYVKLKPCNVPTKSHSNGTMQETTGDPTDSISYLSTIQAFTNPCRSSNQSNVVYSQPKPVQPLATNDNRLAKRRRNKKHFLPKRLPSIYRSTAPTEITKERSSSPITMTRVARGRQPSFAPITPIISTRSSSSSANSSVSSNETCSPSTPTGDQPDDLIALLLDGQVESSPEPFASVLTQDSCGSIFSSGNVTSKSASDLSFLGPSTQVLPGPFQFAADPASITSFPYPSGLPLL